MYTEQTCKVKWNKALSESFSIVNGVRQGAVLSPSLFSLYIDKLLISLETSGYGCHIGNYFYGASAYADDIILLSPTRSGLQVMFDICFNYFNDHDITISTNIDPIKSKTKCIYFPHGNQLDKPTPILMGGKELPWVDNWPHLGNMIHNGDFRLPGKCSFTHDLISKRGTLIGKFHGLFQEFGFSDSSIMLQMMNIYATSFYGSHLWDFSSNEANKLFTSWNVLIRTVFKVPNKTHGYLIEPLSSTVHLKAILLERYLGFINSILNSSKKCLSSLGLKMLSDHGSVTKQNLILISNESSIENVLDVSPSYVVSSMLYYPTPPGEEWRVGFLEELLELRKHTLELDWEQDIVLSSDELEDLIEFVSSS